MMKEACVLVGVDIVTKVMYELPVEATEDINGAGDVLKDFNIIEINEFNDRLGNDEYINIFYVMNYPQSYNTKKIAKYIFVKLYNLYRQNDKSSSLTKNIEVEDMTDEEKKIVKQRMCRLAFKLKKGGFEGKHTSHDE